LPTVKTKTNEKGPGIQRGLWVAGGRGITEVEVLLLPWIGKERGKGRTSKVRGKKGDEKSEEKTDQSWKSKKGIVHSRGGNGAPQEVY
jgi:hypothetical protein